jgi:hypothetical protein
LRARRSFEKEIDLSAPTQCGALFLYLAVKFDEFFGEIQKAADFRVRKPLNPQQVPTVEDE